MSQENNKNPIKNINQLQIEKVALPLRGINKHFYTLYVLRIGRRLLQSRGGWELGRLKAYGERESPVLFIILSGLRGNHGRTREKLDRTWTLLLYYTSICIFLCVCVYRMREDTSTCPGTQVLQTRRAFPRVYPEDPDAKTLDDCHWQTIYIRKKCICNLSKCLIFTYIRRRLRIQVLYVHCVHPFERTKLFDRRKK